MKKLGLGTARDWRGATPAAGETRDSRLQAIADEVMDEYEDAFKTLAK